MTLPGYTLRLLEERYSEEAMKTWRQSQVKPFTFDPSVFAAFGIAVECFSAAVAAFSRPRPVYAPSSPLTLALLKELYGGPE